MQGNQAVTCFAVSSADIALAVPHSVTRKKNPEVVLTVTTYRLSLHGTGPLRGIKIPTADQDYHWREVLPTYNSVLPTLLWSILCLKGLLGSNGD